VPARGPATSSSSSSPPVAVARALLTTALLAPSRSAPPPSPPPSTSSWPHRRAHPRRRVRGGRPHRLLRRRPGQAPAPPAQRLFSAVLRTQGSTAVGGIVMARSAAAFIAAASPVPLYWPVVTGMIPQLHLAASSTPWSITPQLRRPKPSPQRHPVRIHIPKRKAQDHPNGSWCESTYPASRVRGAPRAYRARGMLVRACGTQVLLVRACAHRSCWYVPVATGPVVRACAHRSVGTCLWHTGPVSTCLAHKHIAAVSPPPSSRRFSRYIRRGVRLGVEWRRIFMVAEDSVPHTTRISVEPELP